jgi:cytochrome c peroxidase
MLPTFLQTVFLSAALFSGNEQDLLRSLTVNALPPLTARDFPSNALALSPQAAAFGKKLFFDRALSRSGDVACGSCHLPEKAFAGTAPVMVAQQGQRKVPSLLGAARQSWFFWDGRKDSLWAQALAPVENPAEFGLTRRQWVERVLRKYRRDYERGVGPLPRPGARFVDEVFVATGKAIAAYETTLAPRGGAFDAWVAGGFVPTEGFGEQEAEGAKLFIGKGRCVECHNGPRFENDSFHNTGVPVASRADIPGGRLLGAFLAAEDPFNCFGKFGARSRSDCGELEHAGVGSTRFSGAFKTPTLRNVALTAPYMHGGQFATLRDVLKHYEKAYEGPAGGTELLPVALTAEEEDALIAFLNSLTDLPAGAPGR